MDSIKFRDIELVTIPVWNKPSYMRQNVYGRETVIPIVEPVNLVSPKEMATVREEIDAKRVTPFNNSDQIIDLFFNKFSETEEGKLKDYVEIEFLGFKYYYHPKHNTYYGRIARSYMLLPIIARYFYKEAMAIKANDPRLLPVNYKDGNGKGLVITKTPVSTPSVNKTSEPAGRKPTLSTVSRKKGFMVYISLPNTSDRVAASVLVPQGVNDMLDRLIGFLRTKKWEISACNTGSRVNLIGQLSGQGAPSKYFVLAWGDYDARDAYNAPLKKILNFEDLTMYAVPGNTLKEAEDRIYYDEED